MMPTSPASPTPIAPSTFAPESISPASISPIVDTDYRLHVEDLEYATRQVEVANVTFQGVEAMTPVLHLVGQTKRLVMTPEHVAQMVEITGTVLMDRWIGTAILLHPHTDKRAAKIEIKVVTRHARGKPMPVYLSDDRRGWTLAFSIVGVLLCCSLVAIFLNYQTIVAIAEQLLELWPLR